MENELKWFNTIIEAGAVKRFHTQRLLIQQDDAQHSYNAALIAHRIANMYNTVAEWEVDKKVFPERIVMYLLMHDLAEVHTGDMPGPFKGSSPEISALLKTAESDFLKKTLPPELQEYIGKYSLTSEEIAIANFVDGYECWLKVIEEVRMGNSLLKYKLSKFSSELNSFVYPIHESNTKLFSILYNIIHETNQSIEDLL